MKRIIALILTLSLPMNSFAASCPTQVKLIEEGVPAPCRGFLFSPEKELEVRIIFQEFDLQKQENQILKEIIQKYKSKEIEWENILNKESQKTELWRTKAEDSTLKYIKSEESRTTRDLLFLGSGIVLTVLAGWALGQASKR